ncbi:HNH endonuclease [Micromonospora arborensis]|uniref:HNH endonuclease n=1 Tax=Micromonospora arborensis TaxID=2116518 RepID=UPI003CC5F565
MPQRHRGSATSRSVWGGSLSFTSCTRCKRLIPLGTGTRCPGCKPKRVHTLSASRRGYTSEYRRNRAVVLADAPACTLCRRRPATTADHIVPLSKGGTNQLSNLRPACGPCNYGRGNRGYHR